MGCEDVIPTILEVAWKILLLVPNHGLDTFETIHLLIDVIFVGVTFNTSVHLEKSR